MGFLERSIDKTPFPLHNIEDILNRASAGMGVIYVIRRDGDVCGIMYASIIPSYFGDAFNIIHLGADNLAEWKEQLRAFIRQTMARNHCMRLCALGRGSLKKVFPELKNEATFYSTMLTH